MGRHKLPTYATSLPFTTNNTETAFGYAPHNKKTTLTLQHHKQTTHWTSQHKQLKTHWTWQHTLQKTQSLDLKTPATENKLHITTPQTETHWTSQPKQQTHCISHHQLQNTQHLRLQHTHFLARDTRHRNIRSRKTGDNSNTSYTTQASDSPTTSYLNILHIRY